MPGVPAGDGDAGLPAGWGLSLDRRTFRPRPDVIIGGYPLRVLRLSDGGSRLVDTWAAGGIVASRAGARRLARQLTDGAIAHPLPVGDKDRPAPPVVIVIPVRDRADGLAATLAGVADDVEVVIVDDGSLDAGALWAVADRRRGPKTVVRHPLARGPAAARNTGWREAAGELVAFVDADVELPASWLATLVPHFDDPTVAAVAPRVVAVPGSASPAWLAAYEQARSPLDLGRHPALVGPRSPVPYVPTTALIVRRRALGDVGGFDESLRTGEDVDLVWRLVEAGWRVRYEPGVTVRHPTRDGLRSWLRQRVGYGRSAASLHARHGSAVAPLVLSASTAVSVGAVLAAYPLVGLAAGAATFASFVGHLDRHLPRAALARLALLGHAQAIDSSAAAIRRTWWPLAAP
ncbi:MAG: mycofactocin biosynthesis glycosyltransferase MftF, partial [Actinomycetota bacterium]|nr:mycofactocin biosynthesis glycosyltransferase MftF [Actinomycetota bacterium]